MVPLMLISLFLECVEKIKAITGTTVSAYTVDLLDKDGLGKIFSEVMLNIN